MPAGSWISPWRTPTHGSSITEPLIIGSTSFDNCSGSSLPFNSGVRLLHRNHTYRGISGDVTRHRLSRAGDRQLNCCLHTMAITQIARDTAGRDYYRRKRAAGKSHREALRCPKRRLSDIVRQLLRDATTSIGAGPAGHVGVGPTDDTEMIAHLSFFGFVIWG
jgi:Transposase IS116/IS110/IS902 family